MPIDSSIIKNLAILIGLLCILYVIKAEYRVKRNAAEKVALLVRDQPDDDRFGLYLNDISHRMRGGNESLQIIEDKAYNFVSLLNELEGATEDLGADPVKLMESFHSEVHLSDARQKALWDSLKSYLETNDRLLQNPYYVCGTIRLDDGLDTVLFKTSRPAYALQKFRDILPVKGVARIYGKTYHLENLTQPDLELITSQLRERNSQYVTALGLEVRAAIDRWNNKKRMIYH